MFHRPNTNIKKPLTKYLQPASKGNPTHSRSMVELNPAQNLNHFNSCASSNSNSNLNSLQQQSKSQKSNSITKAFKSNSNSKPFGLSKIKKNNGQIFTCSIANMRGYNPPDSTNRSSRNGNIKEKQQRDVTKKQMSKDEDNYNLLVKLRQFIEELKIKQEKHITKINQLETQNQSLKERTLLLEDRIEVFQHREAQVIKKLKKLQSQKGNKPSMCQQHELIIQSLKNVINEQLGKIIALEQERLSQNKQNMMSNSYSSELQGSQKMQNEEVYSFKKKKKNINLNTPYNNSYKQNQSLQNSRVHSSQSFPQPYNQILSTLQNQSEDSEKQGNDHILLEVGNYLSNFRKKNAK